MQERDFPSKFELSAFKQVLGFPILKITKNLTYSALADVAQWIESWPVNQRVASLIPSLGHMHGLQARSPVGGL